MSTVLNNLFLPTDTNTAHRTKLGSTSPFYFSGKHMNENHAM